MSPQSRSKPDEDAPEVGAENGAGAAEDGAVQVPEGWASVLFDKAFELSEKYTALVKARKANRDSLRGLAAQGLLSEEERDMLEELYPERDTHRRTAEERAAALEEKARVVREKAAAKAAEDAAKVAAE